MKRLQSQCEQLQSDLSQTHERSRQWQLDAEATEMQNKGLQNKISALSKHIHSLDSQIMHLNEHEQHMRNQLDDADALLAATKQEARDHEVSATQLQVRRNDWCGRLPCRMYGTNLLLRRIGCT